MSGAKLFEWLVVGGVMTAIVKFIENVVLCKMKNKCSDQQVVNESIAEILITINMLRKSETVLLHDRLKYLCRSYITKGSIPYDDRRDISIMKDSYVALGGNGSIVHLVETVMALPLIGK